MLFPKRKQKSYKTWRHLLLLTQLPRIIPVNSDYLVSHIKTRISAKLLYPFLIPVSFLTLLISYRYSLPHNKLLIAIAQCPRTAIIQCNQSQGYMPMSFPPNHSPTGTMMTLT